MSDQIIDAIIQNIEGQEPDAHGGGKKCFFWR